MKASPEQHPGRPRRGFTIMEVVITFIIIGILVLILTPAVTNRARDARIAAAEQEVNFLKDAQERAAIDTAYLYRLNVLDDGDGGDGVANTDAASRIEGILDNSDAASGLNPYTNPEEIFILPSRQDFAANQTIIFERLSANETEFNWNGPYVTWKRDGNNNDWPDDPWGNDYLFFTFFGVLIPPPTIQGTDRSFEFQENYQALDNDGATVNYDAEVFGRPTILSMGPNGAPGDGTSAGVFGTDDDIFVEFGGAGFDPNATNNP